MWIDSFMKWSRMKAIRSQMMQASGLGLFGAPVSSVGSKLEPDSKFVVSVDSPSR